MIPGKQAGPAPDMARSNGFNAGVRLWREKRSRTRRMWFERSERVIGSLQPEVGSSFNGAVELSRFEQSWLPSTETPSGSHGRNRIGYPGASGGKAALGVAHQWPVTVSSSETVARHTRAGTQDAG